MILKDERYTPAEIVEAARRVMGSIDVDPASSDIAQQTVKAGTYYTLENSGLEKDWPGNVFLNAPFSPGKHLPFAKKLIEQVDAGITQQAVVVTRADSSTEWFRCYDSRCQALALTPRVQFHNPYKTGSDGGNNATNFIFYIGDHADRFKKEFGDLFHVYFKDAGC